MNTYYTTEKGFCKNVCSVGVPYCIEAIVGLWERKNVCLEAAEMWTWRRMTRTSWTETKCNIGAFRQLKCRTRKNNQNKKIRTFDYFIRHNILVGNIFMRKLIGKKVRGRPKDSYSNDKKDGDGCGDLWRAKDNGRRERFLVATKRPTL